MLANYSCVCITEHTKYGVFRVDTSDMDTSNSNRVYLCLEEFLKGSIVSLFLFLFLMTVECFVTDDLIVMIMGIIIKR